jgi:hypothetical protein
VTDCFIHPFPGRHVALQWVADEPIPSEPSLAETALAALQELREVVEPLAADLALVCSEREERWPQSAALPPRPFWHLRVSGLTLPLPIAPKFVDADVSEIVRLDRTGLQQWIEHALAQPCEDPGALTAWAEVSIPASGVRLYRDVRTPALTMRSEEGAIDAPVHVDDNRLSWVWGPVEPASSSPPMDLAFYSEGGVLSLKIHVHWSWWTTAGSPERQALDRALERIRASGWELISTDLPAA